MKPKILTVLPGYSRSLLLQDALAGLTVAMVALPLQPRHRHRIWRRSRKGPRDRHRRRLPYIAFGRKSGAGRWADRGVHCRRLWGDRRVVLSRFSSGLFRAMFAMKEIWNGNEIHRRVSA